MMLKLLLGNVERDEVLPVAFGERDEMVEHTSPYGGAPSTGEYRNRLASTPRIVIAMHAQDGRQYPRVPRSRADLALRLPIAMGMNNVEAAVLEPTR